MRKQAPAPRAGLWERLLCLLFPARCLLCGEPAGPGEAFCETCGRMVPAQPMERRESLSGAGGAGFRILSPLPYRGGLRKTLYRFKFRGERSLAGPLGRLMAKAASGFAEHFDAVVYVPLSRRGRKRRGYNQSRLLAQAAAKALGLPVWDALEKIRETGTQHELSRKGRRENVKGAYRAKGGLAGKTLLLVDDIVTTGATLRECAGALYRAGAKRVCGLCAADAELELRNERDVKG